MMILLVDKPADMPIKTYCIYWVSKAGQTFHVHVAATEIEMVAIEDLIVNRLGAVAFSYGKLHV